jgi:hypothetical protein
LGAAEEAVNEVILQHRSLAKKIAAFPAKTLEGLRVRALILAEILSHFGDEDADACSDELMYRSIVRDFIAMAGPTV